MSSDPAPCRRWFRFRLRTLFVVLTAVGLASAWYLRDPEYYLTSGKHENYSLVACGDKVLLRRTHYGEKPSEADLQLPPPPAAEEVWRVQETADGSLVSCGQGFMTFVADPTSIYAFPRIHLTKTATSRCYWDLKKRGAESDLIFCFSMQLGLGGRRDSNGQTWWIGEDPGDFGKRTRYCSTDSPSGPLIVTDREMVLIQGYGGPRFRPLRRKPAH